MYFGAPRIRRDDGGAPRGDCKAADLYGGVQIHVPLRASYLGCTGTPPHSHLTYEPLHDCSALTEHPTELTDVPGPATALAFPARTFW